MLGDYVKGANGMDCKPPLYIMVKVVKFLPDHMDLCIDEREKEGFMKIQPYHPHANEDLVINGEPLVIEEGACCHYLDETQAELGLHPFADQTNGLWVVGIGLGTAMHYTMVFCTRSLCAQIMSWYEYLCHGMEGRPHMKLPHELAELLLGELMTVVMRSTKMMIVLYRTFRLQFMHAEHIHGKYGSEPGYICKSWITLDEHGLVAFLDQEMLPTELTSAQDLQFLHFPKSSMTSWGFDRHTYNQ